MPESQAFEHLSRLQRYARLCEQAQHCGQVDDLALVDEGHDPHLALAIRADEGVGLPDFLDEVPPFLGWDAPGLVFGHVDDLHALLHLFVRLLFFVAFLTLSPHLVGVPAVVTHKLKTLVGDVLGDGGDKVAGGEDLKVAVNLGVHAGTVDDGAVLVDGVGRLELHFFGREGVADDLPAMLRLLAQASIALQAGVAGDAFEVVAFVGLDAAAAMHVEAGVLPLLEHAGALGWQEALLAEEGDEPGAEQLLHRVHAVVGEDEEAFVAQEQPVGHEQVQVGMKVEIFPESMYGHNDTWHTLGLIQGDPHDIADTLLGDAAEVFEQIAVVAKIRAQHFGDGEGDVAVGNRKKDVSRKGRLLGIPRRSGRKARRK